MSKYVIIPAIVALLSSSVAFAHMGDSAACDSIAKACKSAGYAKEEGDKTFWQDCMFPVLLNKSVKNVTIDADTVKQCRTDKIKEMKDKIDKLESVNK